MVVWFYELTLSLLGLEENLEGRSRLVIRNIQEGVVSFFNKDDADALEVVNHSLVLDIWNRLRKNRIVVVIMCNKEILVCVQQTQWEGSRGVDVQCALLP